MTTQIPALLVGAALACAGCTHSDSAAPTAPTAPTATAAVPRDTTMSTPAQTSDTTDPYIPQAAHPPVPGRAIAPPIPTGESEASVNVGQMATLRGVEVTVDDVTFDSCLGDYMQAGPGLTYLFADATMTNRAYPGTANYGAFDWVLTDATGEEYHSMFGLPCRELDEDVAADLLNPGVTARTRMAYEIPGNARGLVCSGTALRHRTSWSRPASSSTSVSEE